MTALREYPSHFRAAIAIRSADEGGPKSGLFGFPESGHRNVPMELAGVDGLNTVQLRYRAGALVPAGSTIEVECRLLAEDLFVGLIHPGTRFGIWDGRIIADGTVMTVHHENWTPSSSTHVRP